MATDSRGDLPEWRNDADETGATPPDPRPDRGSTVMALSSLIIGLAIVAAIAFFALRGTGTTGDGDESGQDESGRNETAEIGATTAGADDAETGSDPSEATDPSPTSSPPSGENGTAVRAAENTGGTEEFGHWIGRNLMTASSVELAWASVEGDEVTFRVHRFERVAGFDPDTAAFDDGVLVYDGDELGVVDDDVLPDRFYTYVLDATVDGTVLPRRWTEALTVDDTEPPSAIVGLEAEVTADGVELSWEPSEDNVEFAAYSVSIVDDDNDLTYIGGGADVEQTSFLDNRPGSGSITYAVVAVDFHDNRTEAATITVTVP